MLMYCSETHFPVKAAGSYTFGFALWTGVWMAPWYLVLAAPSVCVAQRVRASRLVYVKGGG